MHIVVLQPPVAAPVLLDQAEGRLAHRAPPWDALALLGYLGGRSRHTGYLFDARLRREWREDLVERLKRRDAADLVLIHLARGGEDGAREAIAAAREAGPERPILLFGDAVTEAAESPARRLEVDAAVVGDPEPVVRALLDNYEDEFRRSRVSGVWMREAPTRPAAQWVSDLRMLSLPTWSSVPWSTYESPGYPGGLCIELALSRGFSGDPIDRADRLTAAPLRIWPMDRLVDALQECAHLGAREVRFLDPPGVWNAERLEEWLRRLGRIRNAQDWSLRLLPEPLHEDLLARVIGQRCRRIEWLVPSTDDGRLRSLGFEPDWKGAAASRRWLRTQGVQVDLIFRTGDPDEPPGEAARMHALLRDLGAGAFGIELHPAARSNPVLREGAERTAREVKRRIALSPGHRLLALARRVRNWRSAYDRERRQPVLEKR